MQQLIKYSKIFRQLNFKSIKFFESKLYDCPRKATRDIKDGSTILVGGYGLCGVPQNLINAIKMNGTTGLIVVSNNCGTKDQGLGVLLHQHQIRRMITSQIGDNQEFERQYLKGELEVEFVPQGTLAEKCRAAGHGIPAFYTNAGCQTMVEMGGAVIKYMKGSKESEIISEPKERRNFHGKDYIMEKSIKGDFALIKAQKADKYGNLVFNRSSRNFNVDMGTAANIVIAEVEEIVENGQIEPDYVHLPGVFVNRIFKSEKPINTIQNLILHEEYELTQVDHQLKILQRAAKEIKHGMFVNFGYGLPIQTIQHVPKNIEFEVHSENGVMGVGKYPSQGAQNADLINANHESITLNPGASIFSSSLSFGMARGGHLDLVILEAMQISENGDLANWIIPGKTIRGMSGDMDLANSGSKVIALTEHVASNGRQKLVSFCKYPLTAKGVVDMIITDKAVFQKINGKFVLTEIAKESNLEDIRKNTGFQFNVDSNVRSF
ncbi:hypothetical protein IMG5_107390 [Ichthyophthirius multifiliis]|uniref:Succinyl-CoA:3-ketoacid-coenzyme A transferase n=1 Tax=Ichthyophthirius multifiliis TaxID=5932 RepID=G0QTE3_ICHMU|nr:hypothetical protein IMG5_107390 [Ichthyophthirius multifiliis]EGR31520.1 hypothetical protein IMG5_107390 [Ichthyophthirius multifiliis]|eukprot:XP_004035006.1 hypothetical protein IMG5_107390 [Ichthyophthirius multifiliis]